MSEGGKSGTALGWILNAAFAAFAVVLAIVLAQAGLSFGQQLLVAVLLIIGGSQLSRLTAKTLPNFHWPVLAKGVGWVFLVAVLVNSSFVQRPLQVISETEAELADNRRLFGRACPGPTTISIDSRPELTLRPGCTQTVIHAEGMEPQFLALDDRLSGTINDYVDIEYVAHNTLTLKPKPSLPSGISEIRVAILTQSEAENLK